VSRIGKQPIKIPDGVTVNVEGREVLTKGPKGQMRIPFSEKINVAVTDGSIQVTPVEGEKKVAALWGLTRALLNNAIVGVHKEWEKILEIRGVGYRAQLKGKDLDLQIGQSHPIVIQPPEGITFAVAIESIDGQNVNVVSVKGIDRNKVGDICATIRALRPPEPYKGKGIRYRGEYVRRKAGKATG